MIEDKELSLNHSICLELLDKFLDVCNKHNIKYYMAFGSCLGAVRHKGFIPWDINIDVLMSFDDFAKLDRAMKNENLGDCVWCCPEGSARMFPLLMRKDSWEYDSKPNIDVSIYVNAPNGKLARYFARKKLYLNIKMFKLKNTNVKRSFPFNLFKVFASFFSNNHYLKVVYRMANKWKDHNSTQLMVLLPSVKDDREHLDKCWIGKEDNYLLFEGRKVRVIENTNEYLTMRYGNYMEPKVWEDKGKYKHVVSRPTQK